MPEQTGGGAAQGAATGDQPQGGQQQTQPQGGEPQQPQGGAGTTGAQTVESLQARISELERDNRRYRQAASAREQQDQERTSAQQTEAERMTTRLATLEQELATQRTRAQEQSLRLATVSVAQRLGFRNPDLAYRLLDPRTIEYGEDGEVKMSTVDAALGALARNDPYLLSAADFGGGQRGGTAGQANDMNAIIRGAARGR